MGFASSQPTGCTHLSGPTRHHWGNDKKAEMQRNAEGQRFECPVSRLWVLLVLGNYRSQTFPGFLLPRRAISAILKVVVAPDGVT